MIKDILVNIGRVLVASVLIIIATFVLMALYYPVLLLLEKYGY